MNAPMELGMSAPSIIDQIRALTGPDRKVDGQLWCEIQGVEFLRMTSQGEGFHYLANGSRSRRDDLAPFTDSLDAALALAEQAIPGVWWVLGKGKTRAEEPLFGARLLFGADQVLGEGEHEDRAALAVCLAVLDALSRREVLR